METGEKKRCKKKRKGAAKTSTCSNARSSSSSSNSRSRSNTGYQFGTYFSKLASANRPKLDDVKTRGKKMAKTAAVRAHKVASADILASRVSKIHSFKPKLAAATSTSNTSSFSRGETSRSRGGSRRRRPLVPQPPSKSTPPKQPLNEVVYKNPIVKELTKELVAGARKRVTTKVHRNNADHPVRRSKSKSKKFGIFQEGRQRPTGPVRTFIMFKATSNHVKRRKARRALLSARLNERRFSAMPVYKPRFYNKSELADRRRPKPRVGLGNNIHTQATVAQAAEVGSADTTSISSAANGGTMLVVQQKQQGSGAKGAQLPRAPKDTTKGGGASKLVQSTLSSVKLEGGKAMQQLPLPPVGGGVSFEKTAHVGGPHQTTMKAKKKRLSVPVLQKRPVRRRSRVYKLVKGRPVVKQNARRKNKLKNPATLALSRKSWVANGRLSPQINLKTRIERLQNMKRWEREA